MVFGEIHSGSSFNTSPRSGMLRFEISSEGDEVVKEMEEKVNEICEQYSLETGLLVEMEVVAKKKLRYPFYSPTGKDYSKYYGTGWNNPCG